MVMAVLTLMFMLYYLVMTTCGIRVTTMNYEVSHILTSPKKTVQAAMVTAAECVAPAHGCSSQHKGK